MSASRRAPLAVALAVTASVSGCASAESRPRWTFFPVAGWRDGPVATALSAIPGVPIAAAGFALTGPLALAEPGTAAFLGPIVLLTLATPVVFPFWIVGRAIDDVARESMPGGATAVEPRAPDPAPPPRPRREPERSRVHAIDEAWRSRRGGP